LPQVEPWQEFSRMAHQALDEWLKAFKPLFEKGEAPTLRDLSAELLRTRGNFLGACLEAMSMELHGHYQHQRESDCPACGLRLGRKRVDQRTVTTLHGLARFKGPYFYCRECRISFHPLDGALALAEEAHQYDIQE
jgi:hypothetical protein